MAATTGSTANKPIDIIITRNESADKFKVVPIIPTVICVTPVVII